MTTRNFDALFQPKAIALVGARNQRDSVGAVLARNLLQTGFRGPILPVNPHEQAIRSTLNRHDPRHEHHRRRHRGSPRSRKPEERGLQRRAGFFFSAARPAAEVAVLLEALRSAAA